MTKKLLLFALMAVSAISVNAQELEKSVYTYDKSGNVQTVEFSKTDKDFGNIKSADVFFRNVLKVRDNNTFVRNQELKLVKGSESFDQYYKGIKVEDAGYTFHYDESGSIRFAHGNYVEIYSLDTKPVISKSDACRAFAKYKGMSPDSITQSSTELIIRCVKGGLVTSMPLLVYKVVIDISNVTIPENGYIDAKTGKVVDTESHLNHLTATGTFYTKYYGTKQATTFKKLQKYYLEDHIRDINVKDLQNNIMESFTNSNNVRNITDRDNYWYYSDYSDSTFMAFDILWALQSIYDRLYNVHGKNSIDNNGKQINAYVRALIPQKNNIYSTDDACWNNTRDAFFFGEGREHNRPYSSLDIVAHEYGHAITKYQIGWSQNVKFLNEGLSDIWGAIMDYRLGDANTIVWQIGENLRNPPYCFRNLKNPSSIYADYGMADTYNSPSYLSYEAAEDYYGMSGVFSHWFYLLVNGGILFGDDNPKCILEPFGMNVAENLIVKAVFENYLRNTTTYEGVRSAFIAAARDMNIDGLVTAVCNAWHAVGVGNMDISLSGPALTSTQSVYTVDHLPANTYIVWSLSDTYYNQNCLQQSYPSANQCTITRSNTQDMMDATLTATIKHNNITICTLTKTGLYAYSGFKGHYTSGNLSEDINYTHVFYVTPNEYTYITSPNFLGASVSYNTGGAIPTFWEFHSGYGDLRFIMPTSNNNFPVAIEVNDLCGNYYQLYAMPSSYFLNISTGEHSVTVSLNNGDNSPESRSNDQPWTLEVHNASTGELKALRSETNRSASVSTIGWPKGIYIVKATIGNEVKTDKFILK